MKKLIIVTGIIMLASCATLQHKPVTGPERGVNLVTVAVPENTGNQGAVAGPENQDNLILATLWYQKSAELRALCYQCFNNAESALVANLSLPGRTLPPAIVFDIDETLLDNSPFQGWQVLENRPFNSSDWTRWVELAEAKPLPGAVEFTRLADSLGVEIFYVSNRTLAEMGPTIENMARLGFASADSTHMLFKDNTSSKVERRALIEQEYEIILLVGDNLADHSGSYEKRGADHGFANVEADRRLFGTKYIVLPNPMYGNWLNDLLRDAKGSTEREKLLKLLERF